MRWKWSAAWLAVIVLASALAGCGDDGKTERARKAARDFAIALEPISNGVRAETSDALTTLNEVRDKAIAPGRASTALDRRAAAIQSARARLEHLKVPAAARSTSGGLESGLGELGRDLTTVAIDIRLARREHMNIHDVALADARLVLARSSGVAALSQALLSLVDVVIKKS